MARPSVPQATFGFALIAIGASGYINMGVPTWLTPTWTWGAEASPPPMTFARHQDRQVSFDLPNGWRWLAQKPDGSETDAAYFPMTRFQGQNPLKGPVSLRVDAIPNGKGLSPDALLAAMTKGIDAKPETIKPLQGLPKAMVGIAFPTTTGSRQVANFVFVKPGGHLSYVLAIGSNDERFTTAMAVKAAQTFQVAL
jgi:hypothetical protein